MHLPEDYLSFLVHFHGTRDYFECHEILEEYWKETAPKERDSHWVGLIQIAVALYHDRRGNNAGASRTLAKAISNLRLKKAELQQLGLDSEALIDLLQQTHERMLLKRPYKSINLPIKDPDLLAQCQSLCNEEGYTWCMESDCTNLELVNRHSTRDRSEVILERNRQLSQRKLKIEDPS